MIGQDKGKTCKEQVKARKEAQTHLGEGKGNIPKTLKANSHFGSWESQSVSYICNKNARGKPCPRL
jgi:hypothetical protein